MTQRNREYNGLTRNSAGKDVIRCPGRSFEFYESKRKKEKKSDREGRGERGSILYLRRDL